MDDRFFPSSQDGRGQLVFYDRPNSTAPKLSRFTVSPTDDPGGLVVTPHGLGRAACGGNGPGGLVCVCVGARLLVGRNSHSGGEQDPSLLPASPWMFEALFQVRQFPTFNPKIHCAKPVPHAVGQLAAL